MGGWAGSEREKGQEINVLLVLSYCKNCTKERFVLRLDEGERVQMVDKSEAL